MGIRFVKILIVILALNQVFISAETNPFRAIHKVTAKDINLAETNQNFICSVYGKTNIKTGTPIIVYPNEVPTIEFLPCSSSDDFYIMFELRKDDPSAGKLFEYHYSYLGDRQSDGFHKYTGKGFSIAVWSYNHKDAGSYYLRFKVKKETSDENGWFYIRSDMKITSIPDKSSPTFTVKSFDSEQNDCDWPMFGRTPEGNRVAPDGCGPKTDNLELKWKFERQYFAAISAPTISNGKVYFGSWDSKLYCLSVEDGQKVWEYETGGYIFYSSPAISNGKVCIGSLDKKMYCLNAENGKKIWEYNCKYRIFNSPLILNGKVYFGDEFNEFYCLNVENGQKVWESDIDGFDTSSATISNGKVYFGSGDKNLYCLNAENGKKIWDYKTGGIIVSSPAISNGKVYVGSWDNKLYCLNAENGQKVWDYETGGAIESSTTISNGKVYFGSLDKKLYCLGTETGQKVWEYETDSKIYSSPAISNGKVYFGSYDNKLYCLNAENGKKIWGYETGDEIFSSLSISNDKVFVGSYDGYLYCFGDAKQEDDDKPMSVSPTSISFGTVDRGKTSIKEVQLTFNTNEVIKGTITSDKRWFSVTPTTFDSRKSPITISCMIEASKLPGKSGPQTAKVQIKMDSGQTREIDVPIVVETQETIDLELQIGRKFGMIGDLKVDLDSPPFIRGGRTLVPVRFISESFGCFLQWEASQKMITIKRFDEVVLLWIGRNYVTVNGRRVDIDTPPVNENGRTYVPIRVISEAFNAMIVWDDTERKLECSYKPPDDGY